MELLESNPEKRRLMEASSRHKRELENKVNSLTQNTERIVTNALLIGGALALTYFVVSQLTHSKSKKKKARRREASEEGQTDIQESSAPTIMSQIGDVVVSQASIALLEFAKEKLSSYLQSRKSSDENS